MVLPLALDLYREEQAQEVDRYTRRVGAEMEAFVVVVGPRADACFGHAVGFSSESNMRTDNVAILRYGGSLDRCKCLQLDLVRFLCLIGSERSSTLSGSFASSEE